MRGATRLAAAATGIGLLLSGACSFRVVVRPPPPEDWPPPGRPASMRERCSRSLLPPLLDTAVAVILFGAAYIERHADARIAPIALGVGGVPPAISAGYGFVIATECRRYERLFVFDPAATVP
jgi:hypothetical protein